MYAIIEDSGSQMKVATGDVFQIDLRPGKPDDKITFDRVLLVSADKPGSPARIGAPYLAGAKVVAKIIGPSLGEKIDVYKFRRRAGYRRKTGHRQQYLTVEVTDIKA